MFPCLWLSIQSISRKQNHDLRTLVSRWRSTSSRCPGRFTLWALCQISWPHLVINPRHGRHDRAPLVIFLAVTISTGLDEGTAHDSHDLPIASYIFLAIKLVSLIGLDHVRAYLEPLAQVIGLQRPFVINALRRQMDLYRTGIANDLVKFIKKLGLGDSSCGMVEIWIAQQHETSVMPEIRGNFLAQCFLCIFAHQGRVPLAKVRIREEAAEQFSPNEMGLGLVGCSVNIKNP